MKTRKKICNALYKRYQKAGKKDKGKILNEYTETLGLNRSYLARLLSNWNKTRYAVIGGKTVKFVAKEPARGRRKASGGKKTGRPEKYNATFVKILKGIWKLFDYQCGKLLSPLMKGMINFLVVEFNLSDEMRTLLVTVSPATIDRKLKKEKERFRLKGMRTTKPGSMLKSQIPIRVCFERDERRPGFFEGDTSDFSPMPLRQQSFRPVLPDSDAYGCRFRLD
jgi:hypothetical protein